MTVNVLPLHDQLGEIQADANVSVFIVEGAGASMELMASIAALVNNYEAKVKAACWRRQTMYWPW